MSQLRWRSLIVTFLWVLFFGGAVYSKFVCSSSVFGMAIFVVIEGFRCSEKWRGDRGISGFKLLPLIGLFVIIAIHGLYSTDSADWLVRLRVKLPFLVIPIFYSASFSLSHKCLKFLKRYILSLAFVSSMIVLWSYLSDAQVYHSGIAKGRVISTPCHHVRYSLFLAMSAILALDCYLSDDSDWAKTIWGSIGLFLFAVIHVLAIRTGIVCVWLGSIFYLAKASHGSYTKSFRIMALLIIVSVLLFRAPTLERKLEYSVRDHAQFQAPVSEDIFQFSDTRRLHSLRLGVETFRDYPVIGVGLGDLRVEMSRRSQEGLGLDILALPHSQFVSLLAGGGLLSFTLFFLCFYAPLILGRSGRLLTTIYLITTLSFLVENTIDSAVGTALVLGFICVASYGDHEEGVKDSVSLGFRQKEYSAHEHSHHRRNQRNRPSDSQQDGRGRARSFSV